MISLAVRFLRYLAQGQQDKARHEYYYTHNNESSNKR